MTIKQLIRRVLKPRFNIKRTRLLINNLNFYWKLDYTTRKIVFAIIHPIRWVLLLKLKKITPSKEEKLSLLPFIENKTIFIRIPKSAGRSVSISLFDCLVGSHIKLRDYQLAFKETEFNDFLKFTIVRNPWDRVVSAYFFLKEGGVSGEDLVFSKKHMSKINSFDDFVKNYLKKRRFQSFTHFIPQIEFLTIKNKIAVDYIGKFENLNKDFEFIKNEIGLKGDIHLQKNNLTKSRKSKNYTQYYSEVTKNIVADIYYKDIEILNYKFGD